MRTFPRRAGVPSHGSDWLAGGERMREVEFDRVHAGNVMHHYADLPSINGNARLPLCLGKWSHKCSECCCTGLETGGEGLAGFDDAVDLQIPVFGVCQPAAAAGSVWPKKNGGPKAAIPAEDHRGLYALTPWGSPLAAYSSP